MNLLGKIFVFPFVVLPESFYRFLSLVLPSIRLLEVVKPLVLPSWHRGEFGVFRVVGKDEDRRKIAEIYQGYHDFAKVHGEKYLIDTISFLKERDEWEESRLRLRSAIKTPEEGKVSNDWVKFVEAALIMELARDLDERDIELDADLSKVRQLESKFRSSLGLDEEVDEDVDEAVKVTAEHLPRRSYFGYMIGKRIASWLRLYRQAFTDEPVDTPLLLCITREVADELVDPVRTRIERTGGEWQENSVFDVRVPNVFESMSGEEFEKFTSRVLKYDRRPFWYALGRFVDEPSSGEAFSELRDEALKFGEFLQEIFGKAVGSSGFMGQFFEFGALYYPQVAFRDLYSAFLGPEESVSFRQERPLVVLFLDEKIL